MIEWKCLEGQEWVNLRLVKDEKWEKKWEKGEIVYVNTTRRLIKTLALD